MKNKEEYQNKLKQRLNVLQSDLDKLRANTDKAEAKMKLEYYNKIQELETKQDHARKKLEELQGASDDAWEDVKTGAELAWNNLSNAIKKASQHFRQNAS